MNKYAARLLKLADFLETVPRKRFNFNQWVGDDWEGKPDLSCGTRACALGWATTMPAFRRLGLRLDQDSGLPRLTHQAWIQYVEAGWNGIVSNDLVAVGESVFGLSFDELNCLFVPDYGPSDLEARFGPIPGQNATPKQVARHIRRFVKYKYPETA